MRTEISPRDQYINQTFATEDTHLKGIRQRLRADGKEGINIGPHEGRLLQTLIAASGVNNIVEVGTLYGYSTLWMARALPVDGKIHTIEKEPSNFQKAKELLAVTEVSEKISCHNGDALDVLETLSANGPFDMVFIDANKAGYTKYLDWAEQNVKPGGLIVGDNTFLFGHVTGENTSDKMNPKTIDIIREFNSRLANSEKFTSTLIPTAEGLTVAVVKG